VQTPEPFPPAEQEPFVEVDEEIFVRPAATGFWALGGRLAWVAGLVLTVSAFTDWYAGPNTAGPTLAVIAWHTGTLGKLVFVIGLGSLATIFVLIRLISIPDSIPPPAGRGIGIWISLLASLAVIAAGLLRASEEL
jgi:hypothetical protein